MNLIDIIKSRYSCRKYLDRPVEREKIVKCIDAARMAPSACNAQPWRFLVLDEPEVRDRTADAAATGAYRFSRLLKRAPVLIAVLADKGSFMSAAGSLIRNTNFYLLDVGIACEHIVLQATELGLGTCYVGWFSEKGVKKELKIPDKFKVPLIICMGYPQEEYKENDPVRRRARGDMRYPIEDVCSFNEFKK